VDVDGEVTGQVNALAVYQIGDYSFGRPSRITAETFMGKEGVVNIEREANLSGNTHDKGVMILSGYLGRTFAQNYPLSLSISITFEQSYGSVDGDSASSSELYAVISSLSGIPINQGIAVTGSVNQKGRIQAIGGVNQKIEGFFEVCQVKGLTGKQGVMIPTANLKNLMLKKEVIRAVQEKKFHIYHVSTVEEGIQILTGVPAGIPDMEGRFLAGTVFGKVQEKLEKYFKQALKFRKELEFMGRARNSGDKFFILDHPVGETFPGTSPFKSVIAQPIPPVFPQENLVYGVVPFVDKPIDFNLFNTEFIIAEAQQKACGYDIY
jgi:predicted ATP-dependent protease